MKLRFLFIIVLVTSSLLLVAINQAPDTSAVSVNDCIQTASGDCVRFPMVTGDTLNGENVTLPQFFTGELNLVIVPFDREQQESVLDWLPLATQWQSQYEGFAYYSVGALPDLPAGVRLLISGGMSLAVEPAVREVSVLLYLDDQQRFANNLNVTSLEQAQLILLNASGDILWQASGTYNETFAETVHEQIERYLD